MFGLNMDLCLSAQSLQCGERIRQVEDGFAAVKL